MLTECNVLPAMKRGDPRSNEAVARRIYLLRLVKGYTQPFAAKLVGVSQPTWNAWENPGPNFRLPTRQSLIDLQVKFGATYEWILEGDTTRMPRILLEQLQEAEDAVRGSSATRDCG